MQAAFEYVVPIIRVPVRARKNINDKYIHGAYVTVPTKWLGGIVSIHLEGQPGTLLQHVQIKGSAGAIAYVSVPSAWISKNAIVKLLDEKKSKKDA